MNTEPDIFEPSERENVDKIQLDHDRKDVPGSPDLARTILDKIDKASVFVADVTPVATVTRPDGSIKKIMNPNVAIELGYALKSLTDSKLLMVMNETYGATDDLPFDLRHKAGPSFYRLGQGASKEEIKAQKSKLTNHLKNALRHYLRAVESVTKQFDAKPRDAETGLFCKPGTLIGSFGDENYNEKTDYTVLFDRYFCLRMIPSNSLSEDLTRARLSEFTRHNKIPSASELSNPFPSQNELGAALFDFSPGKNSKLRGFTQLLRNGEIWGVNYSNFHSYYENSKENLVVLDQRLETVLLKIIPAYARYLSEDLQSDFPLSLEFSAKGLHGYSIATDGQGASIPADWPSYRPFHLQAFIDDSFEFNKSLNSCSSDEINSVVTEIMSKLIDAAGAKYQR